MLGAGEPKELPPGQVERQQGGAPTTDLPLLPLFNAVLLPSGVMRVTIPAGWRKSTALVEMLLQQQGGEVLVAAVPYLTLGGGAASKGATPAAAVAGGSSIASGEEDGVGDDHLDLDRLHHTGTAARVLQLVRRTQSGGWSVTVEGRCRLRVCSVHLSSCPLQEHYEATVEQLDYFAGPIASASSAAVNPTAAKEQEELLQQLLKGTRRLFMLIQGEGEGREAAARVARGMTQQGPTRMADVLGSLVARALPDRLALLAELDVTERLQMVVRLLSQMLDLAEKAAAGSTSPRGWFRRHGGTSHVGSNRALRLLPGPASAPAADEQDENEEDEEDSKRELAVLMEKLKSANPSPEVLRAAQREFKRLQRGSDAHPGYLMSLNYLETLADLPWNRHSGQLQAPVVSSTEGAVQGEQLPPPRQPPLQHASCPLPLDVVRQQLDEAHYGLDKVKERIVQYVAVQRLRGWDVRAPILCFIGPPGVGKTSLARSIAEVLGRPFQRISLGGVRDEAEVRGHRRTYIGAMPGRLIQAVRKAGVRDPVLLLDEVDKMGRDASRGDPAAALLEVLDPEQNTSFVDTYLGLPFDLSTCLFVATANRSTDIPPPLLDRLEVVQLGGCTREEKVHIAERHLIPRLLTEHGLHQGQLVFPVAAVRSIIEGWTREAGVRGLARGLAAVCRHVAVQVVQQQEQQQLLLGTTNGQSSRGLFGGLGDGSDADPAQPEPLPMPEPLEQARTGASEAEPSSSMTAVVARSRVSFPQPAARRSKRQAKGGAGDCGSGGSLHLLKPVPGCMAGVQLWMELASLVVNAGNSSVVGAVFGGGPATGGYPWPQLQDPHGRAAAGLVAAPDGSADCTCSHRKQNGWFSWLRWPWHDGAADEHAAQQQQQHKAGGDVASGSHCTCEGPFRDHDCCCAAHSSNGTSHKELPHDQPHSAAAAAWAHQESGVGAEGSGWELSGRQSDATQSSAAAQAEPPRLCGPGSMQILSPPPGAVAAAPPCAAAAGTAAAEAHWQPGRCQQAAHARQQMPRHPHLPQVVVDDAVLEAVLGPRRYERHSTAERVTAPGTAAGLVWTAVGGKVQYIECICVGTVPSGSGGDRGGGQLTLTGQLGEVLEESARIALSWVRAHAPALGLPGDASCPSRKWDVHIHLPAGAVPKDGPSAGITLAVALVSLFTERCVRADVAMTGELTLRGLVLPVGGIKEKLLAAQAAGMAHVLVPARNMPDVQADMPAEVWKVLEVVPCQRLEDVLQAAFDPPLTLKQPPLLARL